VNNFDGFAEITLAIFVAITALIWLLTYLEQTRCGAQTKEEPPT